MLVGGVILELAIVVIVTVVVAGGCVCGFTDMMVVVKIIMS